MELPTAAAGPSHHSVASATYLSTLPRELVHQVFDDLGRIGILTLLCSKDDAYLDECAHSHLAFGKHLEAAPGGLPRLKECFALLLEIQRRGGLHVEVLERDLDGDDMRHVRILRRIGVALRDRYDPHLEALSELAPSPISMPDDPTAERMRALCDALWAAEEQLKRTKVSQLRRLSALFAEYRGMLRLVGDNSQEVRGPGHHEHCLRRWEWLEACILRKPLALSASVFGSHRFPVVPYDRFLRLFLKVLGRFPLARGKDGDAGERGVKGEGEGGGEGEDTARMPVPRANPASRRPYPYPTDIAQCIGKAVDGMSHVYQRPKTVRAVPLLLPLLRTRNTPFSAKHHATRKGMLQPKFADTREEPPSVLARQYMLLPHDEREFEWLESFLRACRFMSAMEDAKWNGQVSVAEYWRKHVEVSG